MSLVTFDKFRIRNVDDFEEVIKRRSNEQSLAEITPISGSRVIGDAVLVGTEDVKIYFAGFGDVRVRGLVSKEFLAFAVILHSRGSNLLWNEEILAGDIMWVPAGAEHDAIYASNVRFALIMLREERFNRLLEMRGLPDLESLFLQTGHRHLPPLVSTEIAQQFLAARSALLKDSDPPKSTSDVNLVVDLLLDEILHALTHDAPNPPAHDLRTYACLVRKTEDYLLQTPDKSLSIYDLCGKLQISRRTLHRAFCDVIGVAPQIYLRNWRLSRVHQDLKQGRAASVTECAQGWGFSELGRFSGYYRELFETLPSKSLGRNPGP